MLTSEGLILVGRAVYQFTNGKWYETDEFLGRLRTQEVDRAIVIIAVGKIDKQRAERIVKFAEESRK